LASITIIISNRTNGYGRPSQQESVSRSGLDEGRDGNFPDGGQCYEFPSML